jgi:hypothetical protein
VSVSSAGAGGDYGSFAEAVSRDGRVVIFSSECTNLVANDTNTKFDVFARDRGVLPPVIYCTAKVNSLGCTPAIAYSGAPSATSPAPFLVSASQVINQGIGLLFYGSYFHNAPFHGGTICVRGTIVRTGLQASGGNPAPAHDCSGSYSLDFNQRIRSGIDPGLVAGASVYCQ